MILILVILFLLIWQAYLVTVSLETGRSSDKLNIPSKFSFEKYF